MNQPKKKNKTYRQEKVQSSIWLIVFNQRGSFLGNCQETKQYHGQPNYNTVETKWQIKPRGWGAENIF